MRILGAILAGGQSQRFGSDKANAMHDGKSLFCHVADALRPQCDAVVVAGRAWPDLESVADLPAPGLGPLGGLAGALHYAADHGFDAVLSCGCDVLGLPEDLTDALGTGPAILDRLPIVGLWPANLATILCAWLAEPGNRSVYGFARHIGARSIQMPPAIRNINQPTDLD